MALKSTLDGYSESNFAGLVVTLYNGGETHVGQTFTNSTTKILDSCKFHLSLWSGSPTGNMYAKLYNITGTYGTTAIPTGSALATSDAVSVSSADLSIAVPKFVEFTFSGANKIQLSDGYYAICLNYSGGDSSNRIAISADITSPSHSGNGVKESGGTWTSRSTYEDTIFYVYGTTVDYSVSSSSGTLTLTGINATPKASRTVAIKKGEFTLTGIDNAFGTGNGILAECGEFELTGIDNAYAIALTYPATVTTFISTGKTTGLNRGYTVSAELGEFTLTLKDNNFDTGIGMVTSVGTLTLTGKNITLTVGGLWTKQAKNTDIWTNETENTASWTNETESPATWSNNQGYLLMEDGDYLLQENGDKIVIAKFYTEDDTWTNETENTSTWTKI